MQPESNQKEHFTLVGDGKSTALELLHDLTHLGKQQLKRYALQGAIWITRTAKNTAKLKPERLRRLKKVVEKDQTLDFYFNEHLLEQTIISPELIEDCQQYSVWLKPRGMLSQGSKWADHTALYRWVEMHYQPNGHSRSCWIVHRLDRATCGLMLLAHSKKMAQTLSRLFEQNQIHKTYKALVWGKLHSTPLTITEPVDDKPAVSHLSFLEYYAGADISLVEIKIETGRKHQIRKHLSGIGLPIVGDRLYGSHEKDQQFLEIPDLQLTAYQLEFECPLSGQLKHYQLSHFQLDLISEFQFKPAAD